MLKRILAFCGLAAALALWSVPAHAQACSFSAGGTTINGTDVSLTFNNLGESGVSVDLCVGNDGTNTFVELAGVTTNASTGAFAFINQFGYNGSSSNTFVDAFNGSTSLGWSQGPGNCGGFDGFSPTYTGCGQTGPSKVDTIGEYWEISGTTVTSSNDFAVHVAFANCTGFFGTTGPSSGTPGVDNTCGAVPEPASLSLLGFGLLGIAGLMRWRLFA